VPHKEQPHLEGVEHRQFYSLPAYLAQEAGEAFSLPFIQIGFCLEPFADEIPDDDRTMGKVGELFAIGVENTDQIIVVPQPDRLTIGSHHCLVQTCIGMVPSFHAGEDAHHGRPVQLALVCIRCGLGVSGEVENPMIANLIPASEIGMGVVVMHTPAYGSTQSFGRGRCIKNLIMPQGMLASNHRRVEPLGRIDMPAVFAHQIRCILGTNLRLLHKPSSFTGIGEVVVGIHILQELAVLEIAHPAGLSMGIDLMS